MILTMTKVILINLFISFFFILFFDKFSKLINIYDIPNERKIHKTKVSLLGGLFIFTTLITYLISLYFYIPEKIIFLFSFNYQFFIFIFTSSCFFVVGLIDDKKNISANKKIALFIVILLILLNNDSDILIEVLYFSFTDSNFLTQNFSPFFTFLCIFLFINALNMYDGSNLQLGNYIFIFICYLLYKSGFSSFAYLIFPITIFIILNYFNKTFMGNSGAYFLGFFLSYIVIKIYNLQNIFFSDEIVLIMFYPVLDLVRLFFIRIINDKNPFLGDRNHIHHLLSKLISKNIFVQLTLILITVLPIMLYEITKINIAFIFLLNSSIYSFIIYKYYLKVTINSE